MYVAIHTISTFVTNLLFGRFPHGKEKSSLDLQVQIPLLRAVLLRSDSSLLRSKCEAVLVGICRKSSSLSDTNWGTAVPFGKCHETTPAPPEVHTTVSSLINLDTSSRNRTVRSVMFDPLHRIATKNEDFKEAKRLDLNSVPVTHFDY